MIDDAPGGAWRVYGQGAVTIYRAGLPSAYPSGAQLHL